MLFSLNHVFTAWFDPLIHETTFYWSIMCCMAKLYAFRFGILNIGDTFCHSYLKYKIKNQPRAPAMYVNTLPRDDIPLAFGNFYLAWFVSKSLMCDKLLHYSIYWLIWKAYKLCCYLVDSSQKVTNSLLIQMQSLVCKPPSCSVFNSSQPGPWLER